MECNSNQMGPCWLPGPRVVTERNRSKAAGRKRLGGTPAAGAGVRPWVTLTASEPAAAPSGSGEGTHQPLPGHPNPLGQVLKL